MAKKKKDYDPERYQIEEFIETISESKDSNWGKFVVKARMDDNPSTIDIRHIKVGDKPFIGKGISLSDLECDEVVDCLVKRGYGRTKVLEEELDNRKSLYGFKESKKHLTLKLYV